MFGGAEALQLQLQARGADVSPFLMTMAPYLLTLMILAFWGWSPSQGFNPWMDIRKLLPGQNWPRAIENAIEIADFFVACFSSTSVNKRGGFQAEIRYALDCARRAPLDDIFMVPVRLDACRVPRAIQREIQYLDLYPDWPKGVRRLAATLQTEWLRRSQL